MDLTFNLATGHGRAQAIAAGGTAADLAIIVERVLETHTSEREAAVESALADIQARPSELEQLDDKLTELLGMVDSFDLLEEDADQFRQLIKETWTLSEAVSDHLDDVDRLITEAAQMLAP